jgi:hypothetical protein
VKITSQNEIPRLSARLCAAAMLLSLLALILYSVSHKKILETDLEKVSGVIESIQVKSVRGGADKLDIIIKSADGKHHLTQDYYYLQNALGVHFVQPGLMIDALVERDFIHRDLEWYWSIDSNGYKILPIAHSKTIREIENNRMIRLAGYVFCAACMFFVVGVFLAHKGR